VIATTIDNATAALIAIAMSRNNWPASSRTNSTGIKTAKFAKVAFNNAPQTSLAPRTAASAGCSPS
jgi:hypothetical protein